ncbi:MAG: ATP-grasp fold amidoligase family protein [Gallionellaceae bacterium]|nr:ATP-grasp fold amidoligase family protein [Gallionellaceae bacterium]
MAATFDDAEKMKTSLIKAKLLKSVWGMQRRLRRRFLKCHGYYPDLEHPRSLSEKIQWLKLHKNLEPLAPYIDKHLVRDFVKSRIGDHYLVPLIGIYDRFEDIDIATLPDRFVMKATHGSGWNIIVDNKHEADFDQIKYKFSRWLKTNYSDLGGEGCYLPISGRILIEEYLESPIGPLLDYKFYCCNGKPLGLHVDIDRFGDHSYRIFDTHWNEFEKTRPAAETPMALERPDNLEQMLDVCRTLSDGFSYVRVDLYNPGNRIYFGELTFTPGNGLSPFDPVWSDYYFGEPLDVRHYVAGLDNN